MDRDKDSFRTVSRLEIVATGRRRRFTDEAKLRIVEEGFSGDGRQVSATALKHDVSRSQLYRWRRLFADPASLDRTGQVLDWRVCGQV
jgi:transposase